MLRNTWRRSAVRPPATALAALLALGLLSACERAADELNSERIERLFGSYGVDVLEQSGDLRLSNLYSVADGQPICRTLAIVRFHVPIPETLARAHRDILDGGSIGAVLRENGWQVKKLNLHIGEFVASGEAQRLQRLMTVELPVTLGMHVYQLNAARRGIEIDYATIIELHHPDYLSVETLETLYAALPERALSAAGLDRLHSLARRSVAP